MPNDADKGPGLYHIKALLVGITIWQEGLKADHTESAKMQCGSFFSALSGGKKG